MVGAVERQPAFRRRARTKHGAVGVEILEIIQRALFHIGAQRLVVLVGCAVAELIPARADAPFKIRNHGAKMMRQNIQLRKLIQNAAEHEPRHRNRGFIGPAEGPPDLVFRFLFAGVVGQFKGAARGMQKHHLAGFRGDFEHRTKLRQIKRLAVDVRVQLNAACAIGESALKLLGGVLGIHRQRGEPAAEVIRLSSA